MVYLLAYQRWAETCKPLVVSHSFRVVCRQMSWTLHPTALHHHRLHMPSYKKFSAMCIIKCHAQTESIIIYIIQFQDAKKQHDYVKSEVHE